MRVHKYRAWNKTLSRWEEVNHEWLYHNDDDGLMYANVVTQDNISCEIVLDEFTGLHDKEGVEIYEGDIINILAPIGAEEGITLEGVWDVFYSQPCPGEAHYWGMHSKRGNYRLSGPALAFSEVIGNIHQHPELMEGV